MTASRFLTVCLLSYAAASLLHHIHNAEFLADYPNMPVWLSPAKVYLVWTVEMVVGACGYVLLRGGHRFSGLALIAVYAIIGFAGLDHYVVAPFMAHTAAMHLTILLEVACAAFLLIAVFTERRRPAVST